MTQHATHEMHPLPCPFCGGQIDRDNPKYFYGETDGLKWGSVACACGACGPDVRTGYRDFKHWRDATIAEWNKRA